MCACRYTYNIFFTYSSTNGHSNCFYVFTIANNTLLLFLTGLKCCLLDPSWALRPSLLGASLVVQWFRVHASTVGGLVSICGGEQRSCTPHNTAVYSQLTFVHSQLTFDKRPRTLSGKWTDSPMNKTEKIVQPPIKEWNWTTTLQHEQK